jgi:hypothetical protein
LLLCDTINNSRVTVMTDKRGEYSGGYTNEKNRKHLKYKHLRFYKVRPTGLEPAQRELLDPKSSASTNSATGAYAGAKIRDFWQSTKFFRYFPAFYGFCKESCGSFFWESCCSFAWESCFSPCGSSSSKSNFGSSEIFIARTYLYKLR